jgi:hypothetical protein
MGSHIDTRDQKRKKVKEHDEFARKRRASFKQYLRDIEEDLLDEDLATNSEETDDEQ